MLKKMRWRFISAAMAAFSAVVLVLLCAINLWNYHVTAHQQDTTLRQLLEVESRRTPPFTFKDFRFSGPLGGFSQEMQYMTRFFVVHFDIDNQIHDINQEHIASISLEDAAAFANDILNSGKTSGFYQNYRYLLEKTSKGTTVIFLNSEREIQSMKAVLRLSGIVALCSLLAVFFLVLLFSKRAIAPYIRNIEVQKRFITDAGHELKTPLTAISTSADVLAMEYEDNEWVRNIQSQSLRMAKLISNLVTLSRLDEEQPFPDQAEFSLSDAIWEISEPISAIAKAKGKNYVQHIENDIMLFGDKNAVQQMVSILLDNAVKYSGEKGEIRLDVLKKQRKIEIIVYNTCTLDDPEHVNRLFNRFYRPDKSRSSHSGGTGIGLSIAKAVAEAHGGNISAHTQNGCNITFKVVL